MMVQYYKCSVNLISNESHVLCEPKLTMLDTPSTVSTSVVSEQYSCGIYQIEKLTSGASLFYSMLLIICLLSLS